MGRNDQGGKAGVQGVERGTGAKEGRNRTDRITGAIFLLAGLAVILLTSRLRLGTFHMPGPGLFPLIVGSLIIFLSLILLLFPPTAQVKTGPSVSRRGLRRLGSVYLSLLAFFAVLKFAGFLMSSFLLLSYLFYEAKRKSVMRAVVQAAIATGFAYLLFDVLLNSELEKGFLGL